MFTVTVDGRETAIDAVPLNSGSVLGFSSIATARLRTSTARPMSRKWNISTMMTWLTFERALIEFESHSRDSRSGVDARDELAMPFMLAGIVDKHIASKTTYPFFYGLIRPDSCLASVSKIIRIVATSGAMSRWRFGDSSPLYTWNYQTMRAITDPLAQPQYTVALAAFGMGLGALCLYGTPFISLYFLSGRIYESVATVVSSWTGAIVGTGIEKYSAEAAASINRQAETTQYNAGYQADVTRSAGHGKPGTREPKDSARRNWHRFKLVNRASSSHGRCGNDAANDHSGGGRIPEISGWCRCCPQHS